MQKINIRTAAYTIGVLILFALILAFMGREFLSDSGFGVWSAAWTPNTSQWLADPYSASHVLHGIIFFWLLHVFAKKLSMRTRFMIALLIEVAWEIFENSPIIINRYREATASLEYFGDSIYNSLGDVLFALLGFWIAYKLPWKWTLAFVIAIELILLYWIKDNLTLNILMLLYPIESIKNWQVGG